MSVVSVMSSVLINGKQGSAEPLVHCGIPCTINDNTEVPKVKNVVIYLFMGVYI